MTRDEAMKVWLEACERSNEAWFEAGEQLNDPEGDAQSGFSNEAAATVIQQAFAERDGEIERLRDALDKAAARLNLAANYMATSFGISGTLRAERMIKLQDCAAEALAAKGDSRG